jgi:hypothetical protein
MSAAAIGDITRGAVGGLAAAGSLRMKATRNGLLAIAWRQLRSLLRVPRLRLRTWLLGSVVVGATVGTILTLARPQWVAVELAPRTVQARLSPDGTHYLVAGSKQAWIGTVADPVPAHPLPGQKCLINAAEFSSDGKHIVTAGIDGQAVVYSTNSRKPVRVLSHPACVNYAAFIDDNECVVTHALDNRTRMWDVASRINWTTGDDRSGEWQHLRFATDGQRVVVREPSPPNSMGLWDVSGAWLPLKGAEQRFSITDFSADGRRLATVDLLSLEARIWDTARGEALRTLAGHTSTIRALAFSPDGKRLITAGDDGTARIWDVESGEQQQILRGHSGAIVCADFTSDGRRILTASGEDGTVRVWVARTGRVRSMLQQPGIRQFSASPDGRTLLAVAGNNLTLWRRTSAPPRAVGRLALLYTPSFWTALLAGGVMVLLGVLDLQAAARARDRERRLRRKRQSQPTKTAAGDPPKRARPAAEDWLNALAEEMT